MSFTLNVKNEIANLEFGNDDQSIAELSGFIKLNAKFKENKYGSICANITTDNEITAKRIFYLVEKYFPNSTINIIIKDEKRNEKGKKYNLTISEGLYLTKTLGLDNFEYINNLISCSDNTKFYMRGMFLGSGSINSPETSNYHLEMSTWDKKQANLILDLLNQKTYDLKAKIIMRRNKFVVYIKRADKIGDFLKIIGAVETLFEFEGKRIQRDQINSFTRMNNTEIANQVKTVNAAEKAIKTIKYIDSHFGIKNLDTKVYQIAKLRLDNPDDSLHEICEKYNANNKKVISKSGVNHIFRKLREIESKIRGKK